MNPLKKKKIKSIFVKYCEKNELMNPLIYIYIYIFFFLESVSTYSVHWNKWELGNI